MAYQTLRSRLETSVAPSTRIEYQPLKNLIVESVDILSKKTRWTKRQVEFKNQQKKIRSEIEMGLALGYISREDAQAAYRSLGGLNHELANYSYLKDKVVNKERVHRRMDLNQQRTENIRKLYSIDDYVGADVSDDVAMPVEESAEPEIVNLSQYRAKRTDLLGRIKGAWNNRRQLVTESYSGGFRMAGRVLKIALTLMAVYTVGILSGYGPARQKAVNLAKKMEELKYTHTNVVRERDSFKGEIYKLWGKLGRANFQKSLSDAKNRALENENATSEAINGELADIIDGYVAEGDKKYHAEQASLEEKNLVNILASDPILGNIPLTLERVTYNTETEELKRERFEYTGPTIPETIEDLKTILFHVSNVWDPAYPELVEGSFAEFLERNGVSAEDGKLFSDPINGPFRYDTGVRGAWLLSRDKVIITERQTNGGVVKGLIASPEQVDKWVEWVTSR